MATLNLKRALSTVMMFSPLLLFKSCSDSDVWPRPLKSIFYPYFFVSQRAQFEMVSKYTQFCLYGLRIYVFFVIFRLYGFLENVFPNKVFAFMDFSLIWIILFQYFCYMAFCFMDFSLTWTILAGTNVVHISGIGCTIGRTEADGYSSVLKKPSVPDL